jgi:transcriptional regulator with XRE-family HTH domain
MGSNQVNDASEYVGNQKYIAENLSALLKQNNLNVNQLAHHLGMPMMTVRRLLLGETEDPRISTLKIIADYFNVSLDLLISNSPGIISASSKKIKSRLIPKLNWEILQKLNTVDVINYERWNDWQSITLSNSDMISKNAFAIESRPSMYPRFPQGTIFIIDPEAKPADGDIVLIKIKVNNEFTLKELTIDPPNWRLSSLVRDSDIINFSIDNYEIIGVTILTMLYNQKTEV